MEGFVKFVESLKYNNLSLEYKGLLIEFKVKLAILYKIVISIPTEDYIIDYFNKLKNLYDDDPTINPIMVNINQLRFTQEVPKKLKKIIETSIQQFKINFPIYQNQINIVYKNDTISFIVTNLNTLYSIPLVLNFLSYIETILIKASKSMHEKSYLLNKNIESTDGIKLCYYDEVPNEILLKLCKIYKALENKNPTKAILGKDVPNLFGMCIDIGIVIDENYSDSNGLLLINIKFNPNYLEQFDKLLLWQQTSKYFSGKVEKVNYLKQTSVNMIKLDKIRTLVVLDLPATMIRIIRDAYQNGTPNFNCIPLFSNTLLFILKPNNDIQ